MRGLLIGLPLALASCVQYEIIPSHGKPAIGPATRALNRLGPLLVRVHWAAERECATAEPHPHVEVAAADGREVRLERAGAALVIEEASVSAAVACDRVGAEPVLIACFSRTVARLRETVGSLTVRVAVVAAGVPHEGGFTLPGRDR